MPGLRDVSLDRRAAVVEERNLCRFPLASAGGVFYPSSSPVLPLLSLKAVVAAFASLPASWLLILAEEEEEEEGANQIM